MNHRLQSKLDQLKRETELLFENLSDLSNESLTEKGSGWSISQVVRHLQVAEAASLGYMKKKILAGDQIPKVSLASKMKLSLMKHLLQSSLKWKAPKPVAFPEDHLTLEELQAKWKEIRKDIVEYTEAYPEKLMDRGIYKHPVAGRLNLMQSIDSFIYHIRHHEHQIRRIRKELAI